MKASKSSDKERENYLVFFGERTGNHKGKAIFINFTKLKGMLYNCER